MEKSFRSISTALMLASAIFLISAVALFFMRQAEIEKRQFVEKRLEELTQEKARLTADLEEAMAIKNDLEVKLGALEEKSKILEVQLGEEKRSREAIYSQLENEKKESKRLVDDVVRLKSEKEQVSLNLATIKGECEVLKTQLYNVQQAKEILENRLKAVLSKNEVELEKIVVNPETTLAPAAAAAPNKQVSLEGPKGEVMVVNKKFDFVVVNLGENSGLRPGMNLALSRSGRFLAMLQAEKVHANMSAAKIPTEAKDIDIREGDEVAIVP